MKCTGSSLICKSEAKYKLEYSEYDIKRVSGLINPYQQPPIYQVCLEHRIILQQSLWEYCRGTYKVTSLVSRLEELKSNIV